MHCKKLVNFVLRCKCLVVNCVLFMYTYHVWRGLFSCTSCNIANYTTDTMAIKLWVKFVQAIEMLLTLNIVFVSFSLISKKQHTH